MNAKPLAVSTSRRSFVVCIWHYTVSRIIQFSGRERVRGELTIILSVPCLYRHCDATAATEGILNIKQHVGLSAPLA